MESLTYRVLLGHTCQEQGKGTALRPVLRSARLLTISSALSQKNSRTPVDLRNLRCCFREGIWGRIRISLPSCRGRSRSKVWGCGKTHARRLQLLQHQRARQPSWQCSAHTACLSLRNDLLLEWPWMLLTSWHEAPIGGFDLKYLAHVGWHPLKCTT
jgi:hypothetical protein